MLPPLRRRADTPAPLRYYDDGHNMPADFAAVYAADTPLLMLRFAAAARTAAYAHAMLALPRHAPPPCMQACHVTLHARF